METHNNLIFYQQSFEVKYLELLTDYYRAEVDGFIAQLSDINEFIFMVVVMILYCRLKKESVKKRKGYPTIVMDLLNPK